MATKINSKIVGYKVLSNEEKQVIPEVTLETMHEGMKRPEILFGSTYKIKTPQSEHALYITINDVILNADTEHEVRRPYEIFINCKNMDSYQWVVALTRILSSVFRKGGEISFLVEELNGVFDPKGGYFKKGKYINSLVSEIGDAMSTHFKRIGVIKAEEMDDNQKQYLADKRKEFEDKKSVESKEESSGEFPASATLCPDCNTKAMVLMDNCRTCLNCCSSKCG